MIVFMLFAIIVFSYILVSVLIYYKSSYYKVTHYSFFSVMFDKGRKGEYLTYKSLKKQEINGAKLLFNVYLPKGSGETTEIDIILINKDGIYVFESKNYSGWIFGSENQRNWTQCLSTGKNKPAQKIHFLNPIFQNKLHISTLKQFINKDCPYYSIIVFSKRCTLKKISVSDSMVYVLKRNHIGDLMRNRSPFQYERLSAQDIESIYNLIYPYTQVNDDIKRKHIESIENNM